MSQVTFSIDTLANSLSLVYGFTESERKIIVRHLRSIEGTPEFTSLMTSIHIHGEYSYTILAIKELLTR
jgi:hypothetical protein